MKNKKAKNDSIIFWIVGLIIIGTVLYNNNPEMFVIAGTSTTTSTLSCSNYLKSIGDSSMTIPFNWKYSKNINRCVLSFQDLILGKKNICKVSYTNGICCTPNWQVGNWSTCIAKKQTRTVIDLNNCGKAANKPITYQTCVCNPNWSCTNWSKCSNKKQTRTCKDDNRCGNNIGKPTIYQNCIIPNVCGNGKCEELENCNSCPRDCGFCPLIIYDDNCAEFKNRFSNLLISNVQPSYNFIQTGAIYKSNFLVTGCISGGQCSNYMSSGDNLVYNPNFSEITCINFDKQTTVTNLRESKNYLIYKENIALICPEMSAHNSWIGTDIYTIKQCEEVLINLTKIIKERTNNEYPDYYNYIINKKQVLINFDGIKIDYCLTRPSTFDTSTSGDAIYTNAIIELPFLGCAFHEVGHWLGGKHEPGTGILDKIIVPEEYCPLNKDCVIPWNNLNLFTP